MPPTMGGPCCHCLRTFSPCWRKGPDDKPVLCNACGTHFLVKNSLANYMPGQKCQRLGNGHIPSKLSSKRRIKASLVVMMEGSVSPAEEPVDGKRRRQVPTRFRDDEELWLSAGSPNSKAEVKLGVSQVNLQPTESTKSASTDFEKEPSESRDVHSVIGTGGDSLKVEEPQVKKQKISSPLAGISPTQQVVICTDGTSVIRRRRKQARPMGSAAC